MADDETPPVETPPEPTPTPDDVTKLQEALRKERDEAKRARNTASSLEKQLKDIEDAGKSELDKLRDELASRDAALADMPKQLRQQIIRFASEASRAGFLDPEDALLNIDVDLSDDAAVKAALDDLAERKPHLVREPPKTPKVPVRPTAGPGQHLGSQEANENAKERAAAALRAFRST